MTEEIYEANRLVREREMLNEAMRQDHLRLAHAKLTLTERQGVQKDISANMDKLLAAARRLHDLGWKDA